MSLLTKGTFIWYTPTKYIFATSSGSWTGRPAFKERPCLVLQSSPSEAKITIIPLVGAIATRHGQWVQPDGMEAQWWHPVLLNPRYPAPNDNMNRRPLILDYNRHSFIQYTPKPCYIWSGDDGEDVEGLTTSNVNFVSPSLSIRNSEFQLLRAIIASGEGNRPIG